MNAVCAAAVLLTISMRLSWANAQEVVYAQVGMSARLPIDHKPESGYYVYWYFRKNQDTDYDTVYTRHGLGSVTINPNWTKRVSVSEEDDSLIINDVMDSDFGFFKYEIKGRQTDIRAEKFQLRRATLSPQSPTALRGELLTLTCDVEQPPPRILRQWTPPETVDNTQRGRLSTSRTVNLRDLSWRDQGVWTCLLEYNRRSAKAQTTIHVLDFLPAPEEPIYTSTGSSLHLPCSVSSPVDWAQVLEKGLQRGSWSFRPAPGRVQDPGQPLQLALLSPSPSSPPVWNLTAGRGLDGSALGKGAVGRDLSLTKKAVTAEDRGNYTCALAFKTVSLERTLRVEVLQVLARPEPRTFEGQPLNLTCTLGHSLAGSGLEVKWLPPKAASPLPALKSSPHPDTLSLKASLLFKGKWRCELRKGNKTLTSADVFLTIDRAPVDVWLWVGIASTGLIVILLIFIARTLIRRHQQRRTQRHKPRFCCCNNPKPPKGFYRT